MFGNINLTPVVLNLIILNVLMFLALNFFGDYIIEYVILFKSDLIIPRPNDFFKPVQIVGSFFAHMDLWHILFNMMALASLGPAIEVVFQSKKFLEFYLFCGILSGILIAFLDPSPNPVLGASGAIAGVIVAFAYYYPTTKLYIMFLPFGIEAKKLAIGAAVLSAVFIVVNLLNPGKGAGISHFGHLAGMASAFLYIHAGKLTKHFRKE